MSATMLIIYCATEVEGLLDKYRSEYDIREAEYYFPYEYYQAYLNRPEVLTAIGAFTNYSENSRTVTDTFDATGDDARSNGAVDDVRSLVDDGIYVLHYAGDADYICNWLGGEKVSEVVGAPGFDEAGYVNISTSDSIVHGQVKQSENYAFARIYEAGHSVGTSTYNVTMKVVLTGGKGGFLPTSGVARDAQASD